MEVPENSPKYSSDIELDYDESIFKIGESLGKGSYGEVYQGLFLKHPKSPIKVAIKKIENELLTKGQNSLHHTIIRETSLLNELNHKNIIKLIDVQTSKDNQKIYLILEYLDTDLKKYLRNLTEQKKLLPKNLKRKILKGILEGVEFFHRKNIIHRDLKTDNILISESFDQVKIGDFGLARKISMNPEKTYSPQMVTLFYRAPEILLGLYGMKKYSTAVDIWSVGCIFAEMILGLVLFMGVSELDMLKKIFKLLGYPEEDSWKEGFEITKNFKNVKDIENVKEEVKEKILLFQDYAKDVNLFEKVFGHIDEIEKDLLKKMLVLNPEKRISAKAALKHVRNFILFNIIFFYL